MGCDAINIGAYDLSLGLEYLLRKEREVRVPFLSANLADPHGKLYFRPSVRVEAGGVRLGIFGLVDDALKIDKIPDGRKISVLDPYDVARAVSEELKAQGAEYVVLLTNLEGRSLRRLALMDLPIDLIIGSDRRNQISLPIAVHDTYVTHLDRGGKNVGRLDLTLLPPGAAAAEAGESGHRGQRVGRAIYVNTFAQLRLSIPDHPVIGPLVKATLERISSAQKEQVTNGNGKEDPAEGGCGKEYVGVDACKDCHPGRYRAWKETAHARAYQTLVDRNRQYDEECVGCHVLAYECDNGAINLRSIQGFANVQCESCHGRGDLHVASRGNQPMVVDRGSDAVCGRCHTPERSEDSGFRSHLNDICADRG